ncbi:T-cell-interacting, activating receptor on myeloid cells protein 1 [Arvicola amphibius]|uniref:T-cell-interacting, activating receptor on myeloid cells protein 1 n=1 Tax=Arvicola amphibius TaxID=1047088 RepID=UPI001C0843B9|nr:T-cell-interacting, activating receptor on myeloid cells protein 1 [Arvicola amphibius]
MDIDFIYLLCLGLCLCYGDEEENEELPRPSISAWPSSVVRCKSNVTLRCWTHFQNVTVTLGKLHNSGYQQELRSVAKEAEFHLTHVQPEDAGGYFCAYKTAASQRWSARSQHLQLVVTGSEHMIGASVITILRKRTMEWEEVEEISPDHQTANSSSLPPSAASASLSSLSPSTLSTDALSKRTWIWFSPPTLTGSSSRGYDALFQPLWANELRQKTNAWVPVPTSDGSQLPVTPVPWAETDGSFTSHPHAK